MISNNIKTFIYLGLWYFVLVTSVIFMNFRGLVAGLIPQALGPVLFFGILTLIYSLVFALLFLRPLGNMVDNFSSIGTLVALDIGVILAVALGTLFMQFSYQDLIISIAFCFTQIGLVLAVLAGKK